MAVRLVVPAETCVCARNAAMCLGAKRCVGQPPGCVEGDELRRNDLMPSTPSVEELDECPGEVPRVHMEAQCRRMLDGRDKSRTFGGVPGQGLREISHDFADTGLDGSHVQRATLLWVQHRCGGMGRVEVVVEEAPAGGVSFGFGLVAVRQFCGVGA